MLYKRCIEDHPSGGDGWSCWGVREEDGKTCVGGWRESASGEFEGWNGEYQCVG